MEPEPEPIPMNQDTGLLSFSNEPEPENSLDSNKDNKYSLGIRIQIWLEQQLIKMCQ